MKKYELTDEKKEFRGRTLYRIKAIVDFSDVKAGDLGGFIEGERNLSHIGDSWVYSSAKVYDNALVCGSAEVYGNAKVHMYMNRT